MRITIFGSSSPNTKQSFVDAAYALGQMMAKRGHTCVNGGGRFGVMGGVNQGCRASKGAIIGVIHEMWTVDSDEDTEIVDMITVAGDDLEERKRQLLHHGDCVIALPGGVGTFDELWDSVVCKALKLKGMTYKPICLVNLDGYYDGFIVQMARAQGDGLLYGIASNYFYVATDVKDALNWCEEQDKILQQESQKQYQTQIDNKMVSDKSTASSRVIERKPRMTGASHEGTTTTNGSATNGNAAIPVYVMGAFSVGLLMGSMMVTRSVSVSSLQ